MSIEWQEKAIRTLSDSLKPVPSELNDLDWKRDLSPKTEKLARHISAFANHSGGGFMVFGVYDDGTLFSIDRGDAEDTIQKIGNIAINNLNQPVMIEHSIIEYEGYALLFIYIPEQKNKPIHLKNGDLFDSYCRSAGQTIKMSQYHVRTLTAISQGIPYELQIAMDYLKAEDVLLYLHYKKAFELFDRELPNSQEVTLGILKEYHLCGFNNDHWYITNIGAILFANNLRDFHTLGSKSIIIRKFFDTSNTDMEYDHINPQGYAIIFEDIIEYIMKHTHRGEVREVRRTYDYIYPKEAIREFVTNALIHQDFTKTGMQIAIEMFSDRLTITNPGAPLNDINLLIHLPPNSRNEILANTMYLLHFCEKRGSGIKKAFEAIEKQNLPAVVFSRSEIHTQITLYPVKKFNMLSRSERIDICYQHACLMYKSKKTINNKSLRERFGLEKNRTSVVYNIISDTLNKGLIKQNSGENESKKFATYIPYYA